ncbi:PREDICTED: cytochrome P450 3A19-like, partial [Wasmannia auropunctata]|uniref:cytochrome P450 3A19-like n=1 Tax=Wasmannia auropunctata TaxID=64793 RepID=UPI0005EFBD16
ISPGKAANRTASQYNNNYNVTDNFQEIKPIFKNYWNYVARDDATKSCAVSEENFLDDLLSFFAAIVNNITEMTSFTMLMLATHTDVQEKLRQEISATFNNDKVDARRLFGMQYFYMVFQETLRLFPISPVIMRQLTGDIELESCTLPEGCYIMIPIFSIHRNPEYWHKPLEFIPERFSAEKSSSRFRYTYIPFGTGLRDCMGEYTNINYLF